MAPVAETQASAFVALDETFAAFARVSQPYIEETIELSPGTLDEANADLPVLRPFLQDSERFFAALQPGARALGETSPVIAEALHAGIPALNGAPATNAQLAPTAQALVDFQESPATLPTLRLLTESNRQLGPSLRYITPSETICRYVSIALGEVVNASSQGNRYGHWLNFISFAPPEGPNGESGAASSPASGGGKESEANHLHYNPLPRTAAPGQGEVCEAGNEKYIKGKTVIGRSPDLWGTQTFNEAVRKAEEREQREAKEAEEEPEGGEEE